MRIPFRTIHIPLKSLPSYRLFKKMRAFIAFALFGTVAFATANNIDTPPPATTAAPTEATTAAPACSWLPGCQDHCSSIFGEVVSSNCMAILGTGPYGYGWYSFELLSDDTAPIWTCEQSCKSVCNVMCVDSLGGAEGRNGQVEEYRSFNATDVSFNGR